MSGQKRASSSSVRLDLPAPPLPVMPMTGARVRERAMRPPDLLRIAAARQRILEQSDGTGDLRVITGIERPRLVSGLGRGPHACEYIVHHAVEAKLATMLRCVDALDAIALQCLDLVGSDRATTADDDADVLAAALPQHVHHVREVLVVAALI